jgi:hypothetical protein
MLKIDWDNLPNCGNRLSQTLPTLAQIDHACKQTMDATDNQWMP